MTRLTDDELRALLHRRAAEIEVSADAWDRFGARLARISPAPHPSGHTPAPEEDQIVQLRPTADEAPTAGRARTLVVAAAAALIVVALVGIALAAGDDATDAVADGDGTTSTSECEHDSYEGDHVLGALDADDRFDLFICFAETRPEIVGYFTRPWPHTLFLPTDDVLVELGEDRLDELIAGRFADLGGLGMTAQAILDRHIVAGGDALEELGTHRTIAATEVEIVADGEDIRVDGATVIESLDIPDSHVYVVDALLGIDPAQTADG